MHILDFMNILSSHASLLSFATHDERPWHPDEPSTGTSEREGTNHPDAGRESAGLDHRIATGVCNLQGTTARRSFADCVPRSSPGHCEWKTLPRGHGGPRPAAASTV
jgi:hypothetical protein